MSFGRTALVLLFVLILSHLSSAAFAMSEEERNFLLMYFKEDELQVVSATRSLKSISRVAENVEIVTEHDIELMNAHTLADVLATVNGVVVNVSGASPGSVAATSIQGSDIEQVVVFVDGINVNLLESDVADIAAFPVQMIDRIEIIKGPASSSWGSSLGGIVNVITKSPSKRELAGTVSASYGERNTADLRAELTGTKSGIGYYLSAGRLQTDGMRAEEDNHSNNIYLKVTHDLSAKTNVGATFFYGKDERNEGDFSLYDFASRSKTENTLATVSLNSSLGENLDLAVSARGMWENWERDISIISTAEELAPSKFNSRKYGASGRITWRAGAHAVVFGSDYDYEKSMSETYVGTSPALNVFAVYANDTIALGKLAITPGLRYDHTDRSGDFTSPSLGVTYELAKNTIVRGYVARGFHLPDIGATISDGVFYRHNPDLKPEKVWSFQAGIESGLLKYVWLKVSGFRHDISDAIVDVDLDPEEGTWTAENADKVRRQGIEAALRTAKYYNFTVSAAATFVDSKNITTGEEIRNWPSQTYDIALKYDDGRSFKGLLRGRYSWWNEGEEMGAKYSSFIFDLNLIKTVLKKEDRSCEVFFTGHNIFNGAQYGDDFFKNARRWVEAGVRYKF